MVYENALRQEKTAGVVISMANVPVIALWNDECLDDEAARILKNPSQDLPLPLNSEAKRQIEALTEAFLQRDDALGLAAPQIGMGKKIIVFRNRDFDVKDWVKDPGNYEVLVNPRITQSRGELATEAEGCLSCPEIRVEIARYPEIKVRAFDAAGRKINRRYTDFLARIVQHEIDHLEGRLIVDYEGAFYCPKNRVSFFKKILDGK
jgi:peptide deformylase